MLCDTGIIVANISPQDRYHRQATAAVSQVYEPLVTTWACLTEAMHLLERHGFAAQEILRKQLERGILTIVEQSPEDVLRACALMRQYADAPMDFADASLVVAAETLGLTRILTLDRHFYVYLIDGKTPFVVFP